MLYTSNDCAQCEFVLDYIQRRKIDLLVINVDNEGDKTPIEVFYYPVLFLNDVLVAYGLDIAEHFRSV